MIKSLVRFRWYRQRHLRDLLPNDDYRTAYDFINRGIPLSLTTTLEIISIVESIKENSIYNLVYQDKIAEEIKYVKKQLANNR